MGVWSDERGCISSQTVKLALFHQLSITMYFHSWSPVDFKTLCNHVRDDEGKVVIGEWLS